MTMLSRTWMPPRAAWAVFAALLFGLAGCATSSAQPMEPPPPPGADADPPGRVGRIGDTRGQVWIYDDAAGEWITAARNRPVTSGDRVATEGNARAEIDVGSTTLLLDGGSEIEAVRLDDDTMQFQLHDGSVAARLRSGDAAREFELLTGEARLRPDRAGLYRVDRVDERTQASVWRGQALLQGDGAAVTVMPGQRAEMWRDPGGAAQYAIADPRRDAFAAWVQERDRADARSASTRYVSPEMTGVDDLDRHGRWEHSDEYGALWVPRVVIAGWAPYRYGHWVFLHPWGWTWVDDAPWGFAPFHYGRWVHYRGHWCWAPGRYVARPVFAPALVGWVGGPRFSVSISVGAPAVGWFPLAPHEVYVPGYRVSPRYVRNVNVTHVTNITNVTTIVNAPDRYVQGARYANRGVDNAVTFVPSNVMTSRQPVGAHAWDARDPRSRDWDRAPVAPAAPVLAPVPRVAPGGSVRAVPGRGDVRVAPPPRAVPRERLPLPADAGVRPGAPQPRSGAGDGVPDFARSPRQPMPTPYDGRPELGRVPRPDAPSVVPQPVPRVAPAPVPQRVERVDRDRNDRVERVERDAPREQRPTPIPKIERREFSGPAGPGATPPQQQPQQPQQHQQPRVMPPPAAMPAPAPRVQQAPPQPSPQFQPRAPRDDAGGSGREGRGGGHNGPERESRGGRGERG